MEDKIYRYLRGDSDNSVTEEVMQWASENEENKSILEDYRKIFELTGETYEKAYFDKERAWNKLKNRIEGDVEVPEQKIKVVNSYQFVLRIAASIAIIFIGYFAYVNLVGFEKTITSNGSLVVHELPDGSKVWLDDGAEIEYHSNFQQRLVNMTGRVYFDVVKNGEPFTVESAQSKVQVLGTEFVLNENKNETVLVVVSGKVAFSSSIGTGEKVLLSKNEKAVLNSGESKPVKKKIDIDPNDLSWKTRTLSFEDSRIEYVLDKIGQHYKVKIKVDPVTVQDCYFSGEFENISLQEVRDILNYSLGLEFKADEDDIIVLTSGCN
jgi:ferric-dicitrate binding protein FerR (iron transport regulator)